MKNVNQDRLSFGSIMRRTERFFVTNIVFLARTAIILVVVLVILHHFNLLEPLHITDKTGKAIAVIVIVAIFSLERLVRIEDRLSQLPISTFKNRVDACDDLTRLVRERGAKKVDLIQFSGYTVRDFLKTVAEASPRSHVRLLLQHPSQHRKHSCGR